MKVYTKNGDKGMTSLIGGKKIEKDDIRVEAYGTIDELNSYIGLCYHYLKEDSDKEALRKIQVKLFDIGAELSSPNYKRIKNITKEDALDYTCQLFEVLSELEKVNIVHRDITPKNILISSDNVVKLIDFGISRKTKEGRTKDTTILGTAGYAAPEQFGFMQTDIRSDIYSVGVVFHEMLTGKMPEGNKCICYDYKEFIQKCINISPENRFQTACQAYKELMKNYIHYDAKLNENAVKFTNSAYKTTGKQDTASVKKDYDYSKMPGFRSGALWKKILGVCVYVFLVTVMAVGFEKCKGNTQAVMYECAAAFMYVFSTVVIAGNYKNWYNRMPIYKDMDSVVKMFSRVILSIMIFYAGIQIEEYMKTIVK